MGTGNLLESKSRRVAGLCVASLLAAAAFALVGSAMASSSPRSYRAPAIATPNSNRCDWLDPSVCLQPWPNDFFTKTDKGTATGRRINLDRASMPASTGVAAGNPFSSPTTRINPVDYNRNDGFSPGQAIVVHIPGMDNQQAFDNTGIVPVTNLGDYSRSTQPVVVINTKTGKRHPVFAELDQVATANADRHLIIRPSRNFSEATRYVVVLRNMKNSSGKTIGASKAFKVYRDKVKTKNKAVEARRKKMESILKTATKAGIGRKSIYLAWDFTTASRRSLSERVLAMRNDAFSKLGDNTMGDGQVQGNSPSFTVEHIDIFSEAQNARIVRRVEGKITNIPCYLTNPDPAESDECSPGGQFSFASAKATMPNLSNPTTTSIPYRCEIPRAAVAGGTLHTVKPSLYGHGLLGELEQVSGTGMPELANEHGYMLCATHWQGFADEDVIPVIVPSLFNLSNLSKTFDRVQQGFLNAMMLGRAMIHPQGFSSNEAFQIDPADPENASPNPASTQPVIDTSRLFYYGISQGGIMGGSLAAVSPDIVRAALGVPGMNYSTLLQRSVDFDDYASTLYASYPNLRERPQWMSMIQMLWDRAETNGYAHHITSDPLPATPAKRILMQAAYGDHQVSNVAADVEARTVGAVIRTPSVYSGRHWATDPYALMTQWNGSSPHAGSAITYWDGGPLGITGGTAVAPLGNLPPRTVDGYGSDPHGYPRRSVQARQQIADFFDLGTVINPCGPAPCYTNNWDGTLPD